MGAQGKQVVDAGGAIVEVLYTGDLDAWITTYDLGVTTVKPKDARSQEVLGIRETVFIIDLATMQIVYKTQGSLAGVGDSSAKTGMAEMLTILGQ